MVWLLSDIKHYYLLVQIKAKDSKTLNIFHKCVLNHYPFNLIHLIHLPIYLSFKFAPNVRKLIIIKPNEDLRRSLSRKRSVCISRPKMKVLDKENRVMVEPLSIGHFQDMEMCFPEWRLHLSEGHQYNGYGKFFFFFFFFFSLGVKICILLFWRKVLQNRGFFSERTTISKLQEHIFFSFGVKICIPLFWTKVLQSRGSFSEKVTGTFFFSHLKPIFVSLFFKRRCPKGDVLLF